MPSASSVDANHVQRAGAVAGRMSTAASDRDHHHLHRPDHPEAATDWRRPGRQGGCLRCSRTSVKETTGIPFREGRRPVQRRLANLRGHAAAGQRVPHGPASSSVGRPLRSNRVKPPRPTSDPVDRSRATHLPTLSTAHRWAMSAVQPWTLARSHGPVHQADHRVAVQQHHVLDVPGGDRGQHQPSRPDRVGGGQPGAPAHRTPHEHSQHQAAAPSCDAKPAASPDRGGGGGGGRRGGVDGPCPDLIALLAVLRVGVVRIDPQAQPALA